MTPDTSPLHPLARPRQDYTIRHPPTLHDYVQRTASVDAVDREPWDRKILLQQLKANLQKAQSRMKVQADKHRRDIEFAEGHLYRPFYQESNKLGLARGPRCDQVDHSQGCDASVLLDSTPGKPSEKEFFVNDPHVQGGLRGFEVIDEAKSRIEAQCPSTVSCADIVAFAARDSAHTLGNINYAVPAGRHDGRISTVSEAAKYLPSPFFNVTELRDNFARKGLSLRDMVTLSGAHSIGITRCGAFTTRLYSFNLTHKLDPSLDPALALKLRSLCPENRLNSNRSASLDFTTPNRLDNVYYRNLLHGKAVLISDQVLASDRSTFGFVKDYAKYMTKWAGKYAKAVVKMGEIEVIGGDEGEIRRNCRVVNN